MKTDQFVKVLKELCASWDNSNSDTSDIALEIKMLRKYFLRKEMKPFSTSRKTLIENSFLAMPSETINRLDPKTILNELEKGSEGK